MPRKEVKLREFPTPEKTEHIKLVKGTFVRKNPHGIVLCPKLLRTNSCKRKEGNKKRKGIQRARPKFLIRNFNDPRLELWECSGCRDFLLRVEL